MSGSGPGPPCTQTAGCSSGSRLARASGIALAGRLSCIETDRTGPGLRGEAMGAGPAQPPTIPARTSASAALTTRVSGVCWA
jgi:hypothetical protein